MGGYADAKVCLKGAVPQKEDLGVQTMPKYNGTVAQSDCKSCQVPTPKSAKKKGFGTDIADAKVCLRGLCLKRRTWGVRNHATNTMELCSKVIASHVRSLPLKVLKEGVWEDTRMLSRLQGTVPQG